MEAPRAGDFRPRGLRRRIRWPQGPQGGQGGCGGRIGGVVVSDHVFSPISLDPRVGAGARFWPSAPRRPNRRARLYPQGRFAKGRPGDGGPAGGARAALSRKRMARLEASSHRRALRQTLPPVSSRCSLSSNRREPSEGALDSSSDALSDVLGPSRRRCLRSGNRQGPIHVGR